MPNQTMWKERFCLESKKNINTCTSPFTSILDKMHIQQLCCGWQMFRCVAQQGSVRMSNTNEWGHLKKSHNAFAKCLCMESIQLNAPV